MSDQFPSWRYGPNEAADIFESEADVPAGWADHPSKVKANRPKASDPVKADAVEDKPLVRMNKAELLAVAQAEGVETAKDKDGKDVPVADATNKALTAAIEANRLKV